MDRRSRKKVSKFVRLLLFVSAFVVASCIIFVGLTQRNEPPMQTKIAKTPEEMKEMIEHASARLNPGKVESAASKPPWVSIPGHPMGDPIWRMGSAEDLRREFRKKHSAMTPSEQAEFEKNFPEPDGWEGYYQMLRDRAQ